VPQLHFDIAYGPKPEVLLGTASGGKVMIAQTKAAAVHANPFTHRRVCVDGDVNDLDKAGLVLVNCEAC